MSGVGGLRLEGRAVAAIGVGAALAGMLVVSLSNAAATAKASAALPPCRLSQFAVALGPYVSEATGQHTLALRLVNNAAATCVLRGYPTVRFYDAAGGIRFVIRHGGDQMITSRSPTSVAVRPGRAAFLVLNKYRCDQGGTRATRRITIGPPARRPPETVSITFRHPSTIPMPYRIPDYCGKGDPGSIITVSPFVPTVRAALDG